VRPLSDTKATIPMAAPFAIEEDEAPLATIPVEVPMMPRPPLIPNMVAPRPQSVVASTRSTVLGFPPAFTNLPTNSEPLRREPTPAIEDTEPPPAQESAAVASNLANLPREIIERIAWEILPELAETIIRQQLDKLVRDREGR